MSNILKTNKMKNLVVLSSLVLVLLSSCTSQKVGTYTDDVYANPKQDRIEDARIAAAEKQQKETRDKAYNDSLAAIQKAKDDANPYYKDRDFKYDDYYDYEYATRIKRFDNQIYGLSYYDNYYTNSYWYSNNPYNYGVSVYNGYSWWGPSYNSYSYYPSVSFYSNWGWGSSPYYGGGYGCYNPYYNPYSSAYMQGYYNGYNQGFNNGWYGYPYNGYGNPYYGYGYGGWNSPYYNGWGYYNILDLNSGYTYGHRDSHTGGNSRRVSNPGIANDDDPYKKYISSVNDLQQKAIKFADPATVRPIRNTSGSNTSNGTTGGVKDVNPNVGTNGNGTSTTPIKHNPRRNEVITTPNSGNYSTPTIDSDNNNGNTGGIKNPPTQPSTPIKTNPIRHNPVRDNNDVPIKNNSNPSPSFDFPTNQNPTTPIRNNGGGDNNVTPSHNGGHRPR